jgi:hypothetical protein
MTACSGAQNRFALAMIFICVIRILYLNLLLRYLAQPEAVQNLNFPCSRKAFEPLPT